MRCQKRPPEGERTQDIECGEGNSSCLEIEDVISLLGNQQRRDLLLYLKNTEEPVTLEMLVEQLAAPGDETGDGGIGDETRQKVRLSLLHNHIPKLEVAGIVVRDEETETLTYKPDPTLEAFLELCEDLEG